MRIDFGYIDTRGQLCVAGWSDRGDLAPAILSGDRRVPAHHVMRFRRRDLQSDEPLGLLIVFPRRAAGEGDAPVALEPEPGAEPVILARDLLKRGELALIGAAVDEIFGAWLRAVALRRLAAPARDAADAALDRVQGSIRPMPAETPALAVNLERLVVAPSGIGVGTGWCLTDQNVEQPLLALVSGGRSLRPVHLVAGSLPRGDLAGYRDRYRFTGHDGFFCAFRLPPSADRDARLIVLGNAGNAALVFGRAAEAVTDLVAAEALGALRQALREPEHDAALLTAIAPQAAAGAVPDLDAAAGRDADAARRGHPPESILLLSADVASIELRDVVRAAAVALPGVLDILPLGDVDAAGRDALAAAANEAGSRVTILRPLDTAGLSELAPAAGAQVVFGRASAVLQLGIPDPVEGQAVVSCHDPVGGIHEDSGSPLDWRELRIAPAVTTVGGALFAEALRVAPRGLFTADGVMDAALRTLDAAGRLSLRRSPVLTFYPGAAGLSGQALAGSSHSPASLDSEMLDLVGEDLP